MNLITWIKQHYILIHFLIIYIICQVYVVRAPNCLDINYNSGEFRDSAGNYDPDTISPFECQSICKEANYSYAAIMDDKYCFCSYTSDDYAVDSKCCDALGTVAGPGSGPGAFPSLSSCKPGKLLAFEVNDEGYITITLKDIRKSSLPLGGVQVHFTGEGEATVLGNLTFYLDGETVFVTTPTFFPKISMQGFFWGLGFPLKYVLKAEVYDKTKTIRAVDEYEFYEDEKEVAYELECPEFANVGEDFICSINLFRGAGMKLEILSDGEEIDTIDIADANYRIFGIPSPRLELSFATFSLPDVVYLGLGRLVKGKIIGFEYYIKTPGSFTIKIMEPDCGYGKEYCFKCQDSCEDKNVITCDEDEEVFHSVTTSCIKKDEEEPIIPAYYKGKYKEVKSVPVDITLPFFSYVLFAEENYIDVEPWYVLAVEKGSSGHIVQSRPATDEEYEKGLVDRDEEGNMIGRRFYIRMLMSAETFISFTHNYPEPGHHKITTKISNKYMDGTIDKEANVTVKSAVGGLVLIGNDECIPVNESVTLQASVAYGMNVTLSWFIDNKEWKSYPLESLNEVLNETFHCNSSGDYVIDIEAIGQFNAVNATTTVCCIYVVTRNWQISTNSPKITPPGDITISLNYTGNPDTFPDDILSDWYFGDGDVEKGIPISSPEEQISRDHSFKEKGTYNVTIIIYNPFDAENFTKEVELFEKMGVLEANYTYQLYDNAEMMNPIGPDNIDVPVESTVTFHCNVTGFVEKYHLSIASESFEESNENGIFTYNFKAPGVYEAECKASSRFESSNIVTMKMRLQADIVNFMLTASLEVAEPFEEVEFNITFDSSDDYTCFTFDGGEGDILQAFGNEDTCNLLLEELEFNFNPTESKRKRREATETSWQDPKTIRVLYEYQSGGKYRPTAEAFNTFYKSNSSVDIEVIPPIPPPSDIWIERNSTRIEFPLTYRRSETFRLETTALIEECQACTYKMLWNVHEIERNGDFIREIDITDIKAHNLSALRFPRRYFDEGLYYVNYSIEIFENDELNDTLSCFTYLEIISTPIQPMMIRGGASYIIRSYGEVVNLNPGSYSVDPDDPNEKDFEIEWSCRRFDPRDFLEDGEEYDPSTSLSLKTITWTKGRETNASENCLKDDKDAETFQGSQVLLHTGDLVSSETLYEIKTVISKDTRITFVRLYLDVIDVAPPSLLLKCERKAACIAMEDGFFVNPSSRLTVRAECVAECGSDDFLYEWKIYGVNETRSEMIALDGWEDFSISDQDRFGIYKTFFTHFKNYLAFHIQVTGIDVTVEEKPKGVAKLYIQVNQPPTGSCNISNSSGIAMVTLFSVNFNDWRDPEEHTIRDYSIYINYEGLTYRICYGVKTFVEFILPPGDIEVMCSVEDELGAETIISVGMINVEMPDDEVREEWESTVDMRFFTVIGKMCIIPQAIAAEALVDEIKENDVNHRDSFSSRVDRMWNYYKEMDGTDTSYWTKEAREEIEEQVRDEQGKEKEEEAEINEKMLHLMEELPMEVLKDAEVNGQAISTLAETKPLNRASKDMLNKMMTKMYEAADNSEVAHSEDKNIVNMIIGNTMNSVSETLADEVLGGNFLQSELEEAYDYLSYNITQPNYFLLYVTGSRWEVSERIRDMKVEGVKNVTHGEIDEQVKNMKNITNLITAEMIRDVMVNEKPLIINTTTGLQIITEKRPAEDLSGETIAADGSTITLPDACILLGNSPDCGKTGPVGLVSVKWGKTLEVEGTENVDLSPESSTLDFSLTNREGNETIKIENAEQPFEICLSISPPSEENSRQLRSVVPNFEDKDDFLVYHKINLDKEGSAVKVDLIPHEDPFSYVIFYGVGFKPALKAHDGQVFLRDLKTSEGAYSILFGLADHNSSIGDPFYLAVGRLENMTAEGSTTINLTRNVMTNDFKTGYSIALYTTGCCYYSEEISKWSSKGCKVHTAMSDKICCHCNHLTMFGSGFLIAPNTIDFSYVFANTSFDDNLIIYLTLIITFSLYIILAIWARWKDRKDLTKLGATPLLDNDVTDKYFYEIQVQTGFQWNAGTKSKVHFILCGEDDETDVRTFTDDQRPIFERSAKNVFVMTVPRCLGQLSYLRIWHDNSGKGKHASWYLKYIVVKDIITGLKYEFIAERWFAIEGGGLIDHLLPVAGKEQTTEFSHLFPNTSQRSLTDNHLWLSVFTRPPRSRFTRVQRLSCCLSVLYLSMLTSAMWYERTPEQPTPGAFKFGPLSLSPEQIGVGMMSNLIVFPPSFLMIFLFRKSRARKLRPSHINVALEKQYERWKKDYGTSTENQKDTKPKTNYRRGDEEALSRGFRRKKKFLLPWWCVFFGWLLVIASVGCSLFFLWAYGLQFGNERTGKWLTSLIISFFTSVILTEPIKIFFLAIIMACLCGNPDVNDDDADEDEEDPHLLKDEKFLHDLNPGISVQRPKYRPMDPVALETARKIREKEIRMYSVLKEITAYVLYLWILMILSYGNRDPNSFYIRETFINNFIKPGDLWVDFNTINTEDRFWNWTRKALIPELFAGKWYNGRIPLGLRLMLDDRNNFKVGYPVLRQVRAAKNVCKVPWQMRYIVSECAGFGSLINEDGVYYREYWKGNLTMSSRVPQEYKYLTASQLNGYPFWGLLDWYGGGGYVVPLVAKRYEDGEKLIEKMIQLERSGWVDKDTRAVFIEFGTYNAQVNLFVVVTIVAEFLPGGGIVPYYHIDPIKLLHYHTGSGLLQLGCQIGFVIFTIYYTISVLFDSCKQGKKYFSEYWNLAEIANLLAAYSIIGIEIYKQIITQRILKIYTETEGTGYIKLQEALILDECFCYLIGFLMSLATLKFIKLLRFNKRIGSMISTIKLCAEELKGYGVCLMVVFFAFVCLFWLVLGRAVREFSSFLYAFESSISMMLKKFNYEDIEAASPIIGPITFFTFALTASVILVNILLTIIIQSFEEVKLNEALQSNDYELVPFIIARLKLFLGLNKNKIQSVPILLTKSKDKTDNVVDNFSGKVDKLLEFINAVYLDENMDIDLLKKSKLNLAAPAAKENPQVNKSRPKKIPRYQPRHVQKKIDF